MLELIHSQLNDDLKMKGMTAVQVWRFEGKIEVVKEAWIEGYSPEAVSKLTKIPIEEIKRLYKQFEIESKTKV